MANDLIKAADDARRLLRGFGALAQVADAIEVVGLLEQRSAEATKILAGLQVQVAAAQADLAEALKQKGRHIDSALAEGAKLVAKAEVKASEILGTAQAEASKVVADADKLVAERKAEAVSAAAGRDSALVKRDTLFKECTALEKRLADAQAAVAKLLG